MNPAESALRKQRTELIAHVWEQVTIRQRPDYDQIYQIGQSIRRVGRKDLTPKLRGRHQGKINTASPETIRLARKLHSLETAVYRKKEQIRKLKKGMVKNERIRDAQTVQAT